MADEAMPKAEEKKEGNFFTNLVAKVKQAFEIGGVKVEIDSTDMINFDMSALTGKVMLSSKSDQHVMGIEFEIEETFEYKKGEDTKRKYITVGKAKIGEDFTMKEGDTKEFEFSVPMEFQKTSSQELADQGGAMGMLGKLGKMAGGEKSTYMLKVKADVEGVMGGATARKELHMK